MASWLSFAGLRNMPTFSAKCRKLLDSVLRCCLVLINFILFTPVANIGVSHNLLTQTEKLFSRFARVTATSVPTFLFPYFSVSYVFTVNF
jgi:hypothetical protein